MSLFTSATSVATAIVSPQTRRCHCLFLSRPSFCRWVLSAWLFRIFFGLHFLLATFLSPRAQIKFESLNRSTKLAWHPKLKISWQGGKQQEEHLDHLWSLKRFVQGSEVIDRL